MFILADVTKSVAIQWTESFPFNQVHKKNKEVLTEIGTCANGPGTAIRAGWQVGADLIGIYDMCHDKVKLLNYFSTNIIHGKSAAADDKSNTGPSVIKLNLHYNKQINNLLT